MAWFDTWLAARHMRSSSYRVPLAALPARLDAYWRRSAPREYQGIRTDAFLGSADRQTAWRIFSAHAGLWLLNGAGWWSIEDRQTGRLVGSAGAFFRHESTVMEMGWNTYRPFWGQGIANEAAAAVLQYAFEVRREPKVWALIGPGNASSRRVAERLGMRFEMETALNGKAIDRYIREA
jgi:RimJ/RimL family protein N-acetyltransferase